jgi:hypothetical protein
MIEVKATHGNSFHLAGIIPVGSQPLDFKMPWDDCLMPIAPDYTAIERAVYECASAGCETIWIVLHKEAQALIRHRLGDWVDDPAWTYLARKKFDFDAGGKRKEIPIYYVPIHPKDRDKRDCLPWSVIYGASRAYHISKLISQWVVPDKYYVAFPYGVYSCNKIRREYRSLISSQKRFFIRWNGKTVADGEYLGFTFDAQDFVRFRRIIREGTGIRKPGSNFEEGFENLPLEERYSARYFTLDKVFGGVILDDANIGPMEWYYNIGDWDSYCDYLGSKEREWVRRPKSILQYHEFAPIGVDIEDDGKG